MSRLGKAAAGVEVLRCGGIVPVREVGDKVEQREAQDIEMRLLGRALSEALSGVSLPWGPKGCQNPMLKVVKLIYSLIYSR